MKKKIVFYEVPLEAQDDQHEITGDGRMLIELLLASHFLMLDRCCTAVCTKLAMRLQENELEQVAAFFRMPKLIVLPDLVANCSSVARALDPSRTFTTLVTSFETEKNIEGDVYTLADLESALMVAHLPSLDELKTLHGSVVIGRLLGMPEWWPNGDGALEQWCAESLKRQGAKLNLPCLSEFVARVHLLCQDSFHDAWNYVATQENSFSPVVFAKIVVFFCCMYDMVVDEYVAQEMLMDGTRLFISSNNGLCFAPLLCMKKLLGNSYLTHRIAGNVVSVDHHTRTIDSGIGFDFDHWEYDRWDVQDHTDGFCRSCGAMCAISSHTYCGACYRRNNEWRDECGD